MATQSHFPMERRKHDPEVEERFKKGVNRPVQKGVLRAGLPRLLIIKAED
jgi:hypothetical protein